MAYRDTLKYMWENQKKKAIEVTWYEMFLIISKLGQVYGGILLIDWGSKMYDSGQSLPFVSEDPRVTSLFIIVLLAINFMMH